jgi:leader peptidase (prepilin peptidase)/N-methyltransferase
LAGLLSGFLLPQIACRIAWLKCVRCGKEFSEDSRFDSLLLRLILSLVMAGTWAYGSLVIRNPLHAALLGLLTAIAVLISLIDLRIRIIPNEMVAALVAAGVLFQILRNGAPALLPSLLAMLITMIVFTVAAGAIGAGKVGAGDVKLAGAMALALGYPGILTAMGMMGALLFVYCLIGLAAKKLTLRSMFAFGPFLMGGMIVSLFAFPHP